MWGTPKVRVPKRGCVDKTKQRNSEAYSTTFGCGRSNISKIFDKVCFGLQRIDGSRMVEIGSFQSSSGLLSTSWEAQDLSCGSSEASLKLIAMEKVLCLLKPFWTSILIIFFPFLQNQMLLGKPFCISLWWMP